MYQISSEDAAIIVLEHINVSGLNKTKNETSKPTTTKYHGIRELCQSFLFINFQIVEWRYLSEINFVH